MRVRTGFGFGRAAVALAVLAVAGIGWTAPASAAPAGWEMISQTWAPDSSDVKELTVPCTPGKVVTGGGAYLTASPGAAGRVAIDRFEPAADGKSWTVRMREVGAVTYTGSWSFTAVAFCATMPSGYQIVSAVQSGQNDYRRLTRTASCPGTKKLLGSGAAVENTTGAFVLSYAEPAYNLGELLPLYTIATARTVEQGKAAHGLESLRSYAICASGPSGLERVRATSIGSSAMNNVAASCTSGKSPFSVGGGVTVSSVNEHDRTQVLLSGMKTTGGTGNAWAYEDPDGYAESWTVSVTVICGS